MSFFDHQSSLKTTANAAATCTNCTAVVLTERPAGFVSFQRLAPSLPPTKNVNSAAFPLLTAVQFSGKCAICAVNAVTTATSATF